MRDVMVELKQLRLHGMAGAWGDLVEQGSSAGLDSARWLVEHLLRASPRLVVLASSRDIPDVVALQVVTVGQRASDVAREWFAADRYQGVEAQAAEDMRKQRHRPLWHHQQRLARRRAGDGPGQGRFLREASLP